MKKPKFKLFSEFKAFINKGSVLDLAVGMIIGGAFTAIVAALVNNILKPLINWIPLGKNGTGLQTILRPAVLDEAGNVLTEALILDWGAVISAIVTFILTALVLFAVIKAINSAKKISEDTKRELEKGLDKLNGKDKEEDAPSAEEEASLVIVDTPAEPEPDKTQQLLQEILEELKAQRKE